VLLVLLLMELMVLLLMVLLLMVLLMVLLLLMVMVVVLLLNCCLWWCCCCLWCGQMSMPEATRAHVSFKGWRCRQPRWGAWLVQYNICFGLVEAEAEAESGGALVQQGHNMGIFDGFHSLMTEDCKKT
jgi:hypothetical protein